MQKFLLAAVLALAISLVPGHSAKLPKYEITPDVQSALDRISSNSLRGNLSFLASDLLEGRGTPSRGLDLAAEYIAAQFRRAGLEPPVNGDYFQVADMLVRRPNLEGFNLEFTHKKRDMKIAAEDANIEVNAPIDLKSAPLFKLVANDTHRPQELDGKVVVVRLSDARGVRDLLEKAHPALLVLVGRTSPGAMPSETLIDPAQPQKPARTSRIVIFSPKMDDFASALSSGTSGATVTVHLAAPIEQPVKLRNVIGVLPGADPALKDTYVLLTAHYDHLGMKAGGDGDRIYNGANDDGSGTVSVIEIANALAGMKKHPARSIVFMTFFGEEEGLIGSKYYVNHPVFPLAKTVADVNLEQVGRTDSTKGKQIANVGPTGYSYSTVIDDFRKAGDLTGVKVYDPGPDSDRFFAQSDNLDFAAAGIPAHSFCVAFLFPDYHALGDEWQKIDYDNMAKVDRTFALGIVMLGDDPTPPHWNTDNPRAKRYAAARKQ
jgi:Zn-dependent M28 family amino/carboxypeptidase